MKHAKVGKYELSKSNRAAAIVRKMIGGTE